MAEFKEKELEQSVDWDDLDSKGFGEDLEKSF
jgi:hypothetical protein